MIKKLALIFALLSIGAVAQLQRYDSTATAVTGQPGSIQLQAVLPGSKIYACTGSAQPCAAPGTAALYSDIAGTVPLPQPLVADANGKFGFYWNGATITWTATPPPGLIGSVQSGTVTSPLAAQQISVSTPQPAAPSSVTVTPVGTTGGTTYYYWVVSNFTIGNSAPSLSAVITNAAATLSTVNYDKVAWTSAAGANTYDVLRTTTATAPTGACACAVATAVSALTANDQSNTLSAYTVNTYAGNTTFNITNVATGTGASALTFTADHGTAFSVANTGGGTFTSPAITPTSIESVLYSDQFPGGDAGARLAAALASLSSAGTGAGVVWSGNETAPVWTRNPFAGLDNFVGRVELGAAVVSLDHQITIPQGLVLEGIGASGSFGSVLRAGASFVGSCSITSAARASNVDTFDTSTSCNLEVGDIVRPVGVSDTTFNVPLEVATVGTNTFTAAQT